MKHNFLKKMAAFVLITFFSTIISPLYSYSQSESNENELDEGKKLFEQGNIDKSIEKLIRFIESIKSGEKEKYKDQLSEAYYYKAKIYFLRDEYNEMEKSLLNLYGINPNYSFLKEEDQDFLKRAIDIKEKWKKEKEEERKRIIEQEKKRKKKRLTRLLIIGGLGIAAGVVIGILSKKKKTEKKTLTVNAGEGVEGNPAGGTYSYKKGDTVSYSYSLKSGYSDLNVKLDGTDVAASGSITMNQDHSLTVSAGKKYTLTVLKRTGVNGTPDSGTYFYNEGDQVSYNYTLQSGYDNLTVTLDGTSAPVSGTITMNRDHTLIASSGQTFSLTVQKGAGVTGTPESGVYTYSAGETAPYGYGLQSGYSNLVVKLDGNQVPASGTITMNKNYTLIAAASPITPGQYNLTVTKGAGVNGTPDSGNFTYNQGTTVSYNYTLQTGYTNLVVTRDGTPVSASGTVTMNAHHTLSATATPQNIQYTLTVNRGAGVNGTPDSGTFTYTQGTSISYNYTLQTGYTDLVVTRDGTPVGASGTVTMNTHHTLFASATPVSPQFTLTVTRGAGVNGTPDSGTFTYTQGTSVSYSYSLQSGYTNLVVTLDGNAVSPGGTVTMNANHTLSATATPQGNQYTLTVTKGTGVNGTPETGNYPYAAGEKVSYNYTIKSGYTNLVVKVDGSKVSNSGTVTMDGNHTLTATATASKSYTLTVTKEEGVVGTPASGTHTYNEGDKVEYNYAISDNQKYQDLVVTLDGNPVSPSGSITMNANHTLVASATKKKILTVTRDEKGIDGNPVTGTYYYAPGTSQNYSYTLQYGYINLIVKLDGNEVAASGTITMDRNHTLESSATPTAGRKDKE